MNRRDLLRLAVGAGVVVPAERFVRRFFPVGIDLRAPRLVSMAESVVQFDVVFGEDELTDDKLDRFFHEHAHGIDRPYLITSPRYVQRLAQSIVPPRAAAIPFPRLVPDRAVPPGRIFIASEAEYRRWTSLSPRA